MLESGWIFVGVVGVLATGLGLLTTDSGLAIVTGVVGFVSMLVWTYGTLDVRVVGDAVTYTFTMPSLTLFGLALSIVPAYLAIEGPIAVASRFRRPSSEDL